MSQHDSFEPQDAEPPATPLDNPPSAGEYLHVAKLTGLIAGLVLAIYLAYRMVSATLDVFMIGFLGILFAIFLTFLSRLLGKYTGLNYRKNLSIICVWLLAAVVGFTVFFGATLYEHVQKGVEQFQAGGTEIIAAADEYPPLRAVIDASPFLQSFRDDAQDSQSGGASEGSGQQGSTPGASGNAGADSGATDSEGQSSPRGQQPQQSSDGQESGGQESGGQESGGQESGGQESGGQASGVADMAMTVTREVGAFAGRFFVTTFGLLANLALIVIVGLYLAASPRAYMHAPTYLFPPHVRPDVQRILGISGETLWRWLLGRFFSMTVSGVGAGVLLYLFDVPSALIIGILTFLLGFIPNLGPLLAMGIAVFFCASAGIDERRDRDRRAESL